MCPLGPPYDMTFGDVRDHSLLIEWQKPVYTGSGSVTGYHVEYAKKGTHDWTTANEKAVSHRFLKVRPTLYLWLFGFITSMIHQTFVIKWKKASWLATYKIIFNIFHSALQ